MLNYKVKKIDKYIAKDFIMHIHYAQRLPSISYCYGLLSGDEVKAILTIGKPASAPLCKGVLGDKYYKKVYELNRLCAKEDLERNALSFFVGSVLRDLKKEDLIIVSYSDLGMNHHGYIYQATNWIYTGMTKGRTDKYMPGNKHSRHYTDEYKHLRKVRTPKHRYIYFATSKTNRKEYMRELKYPILDKYPKGDNDRYILGERMKTKVLNTIDGTNFYE